MRITETIWSCVDDDEGLIGQNSIGWAFRKSIENYLTIDNKQQQYTHSIDT
jgi:hypothetical protein